VGPKVAHREYRDVLPGSLFSCGAQFLSASHSCPALDAGFVHVFTRWLHASAFQYDWPLLLRTPRVEDRLGAKGFLWLYLLSGLGAALFHFVFSREYPVVGASGAVYGVLLAFAMYWPRVRIYLWAILPIEAWLLATLLVFGSLYAGVNPSVGSRTAHFAHLGGLAFAFVFIKWWEWRKGAAKRAFDKKLHPDASSTGPVGDRLATARWKGIVLDSLHELNRGEVVRLLAKVESEGVGNLRPSERQFLDRMSVD